MIFAAGRHRAVGKTDQNRHIGLARTVVPAPRHPDDETGKLFDLSQIGGARAIDYEAVKDDTSGPRQDQITAAQDDAPARGDRHP